MDESQRIEDDRRKTMDDASAVFGLPSSVVSPRLVFDFRDATGALRRRCFARPVAVIEARTVADVRPALREVERAAARGLFAAGFVAYEAAPAFDAAFAVRGGGELPLAWFGLFEAPETNAPQANAFELTDWLPVVSRGAFDLNIAAIRAAIGRGDTYQVNYTMRLRAGFRGEAFGLYEQMRDAQAGGFAAYLDTGRFQIASASPELFFQWDGERITTRPMKGTAPRGRWPAEDEDLAEWLAASEKNRAENLMIVDLLRNDLGRVAQFGTVQVPELFTVERYRTVHQMTSTVIADTRLGTTLEDIFAALFPCGSITGAPKIATMQLIAALETTPRGVYCGAIGIVEPGGVATFNVAIRTAVVDSARNTAEYGVGGGITWDSRAADEYDEALLKAALLMHPWPAFELLETMRLERGEYALLDRHLARIAASATYFGILFDRNRTLAALDSHSHEHPREPRRVRLLLSMQGEPRVSSTPLPPHTTAPLHVAWARAPIDSRDRFLFHKTTHRATYETRRAEHPDVDDVLLWNERGEATEFTVGNLVAELDGVLWTPPIASGVLPGTLRADLLERGEIRERVLMREDVKRATRLWLVNSVRGWVAVELMR